MSARSRNLRSSTRMALRGLCLCASATVLAGGAQAGCSPGSAGPRDFVCTGTIAAQNMLSARTIALVGATGNGTILFTPTTGGNISLSLDAKSSIAAAGDGVRMSTSLGTIDTNTPSGSGINGAITSNGGIALFALTSGAGSNININTGINGAITGASGGIVAATDTDGAVNLALQGKIASRNGAAIDVQTADGAINITAQNTVSGGTGGVLAHTTGLGLIAINGASAISATNGPAIQAIADGTGNVTANLYGAITAGTTGIVGMSAGGNVTLTSAGAITGQDGIIASTTLTGAATVTTGGLVTATNGNGVIAQSVDGWTTVNVGAGGVSGSGSGVLASSTGLGPVMVAAHGDVAGTTTIGIGATTTAGSIEIDLDKGKFISGGVAAVAVTTASGAATVNNAATISGITTGAGVVADLGAGAMMLNNTGVIRGTTGDAIDIVSGAALVANTGVIDGKVRSAGLATVNNDGVWNNAAGSTISYLNNTGALNMGGSGKSTLDVLTVLGDASFSKTSSYNARISATGNDAIAVAGQTTIDGGVVKITGIDTSYQRGAKYLMLNSAGGLTGQFDSVVSDISKYTGVLSYDANDVYMTLLQRDFRMLALNRNQLSVATGLYNGTAYLAAGPGATLLTAINNVPDAGVPGVLTQLSGDGVVTGAANAAMQAGHLFTSVLDDQQSLWRSGGARDTNGIVLRDMSYAPQRVDGYKWPVSRQAQRPVDPPRVVGERTWRVWSAGFGGHQTLGGDSNAGSSGQAMSSFGGALGIDYQLGRNLLVGVAGGYSNNSFSAASAQGTSDGFHFGGYAGFRIASFYGSASVAYSAFDNKSKRTITPFGGAAGDTLTGSFGSEEVRTRVEIGRKFDLEALAITPFTAAEIAHIHTKPFVEASSQVFGGGLFNLSYAGQGINSLPTFIGVKAESRIELGDDMAFTPWISVAWRHEWAGNRTQTATLVALPTASFVAIGARPAPDTVAVKAGAQIEITKTAAVFASFEGEFLSKNPVYAGKGGVKIGW